MSLFRNVSLKRGALIGLLVLGVLLLLSSCGKDGNIYGDLTWDGYVYSASVGGFPSLVTSSTEYQISAGSYNVYYTLQDPISGYYYPGYYESAPTDPSYYYSDTYTVSVNKGGILTNGADNYFSLYMSYGGLVKSGSVSYAAPQGSSKATAPQLGTQSWTEDGLLITVTNQIVKLSADDVAKLKKTQFKSK